MSTESFTGELDWLSTITNVLCGGVELVTESLYNTYAAAHDIIITNHTATMARN
jgi:hypothetical protein